MKLTATKRIEFCYAHMLKDYQGLCANVHGHNAMLEVTVSGQDPLYPEHMVMDFSALKHVIVKHVARPLDHKMLNEIPGLSDMPTAENMAREMWVRLEAALPSGVVLERIKLSETRDSWIELAR